MWKKYNKYANCGGSGPPTAAPTGRRPLSGDDSQDEFQLESELCRLRRQLHVMEGDRRAYSEESCNLLRKQQSEIQNLKAESEEVGKILRLAKSERNQTEDFRDSQKLNSLTDNLDALNIQCLQEKRRIQDLDEEILSIQQLIGDERKVIGSADEEELEIIITKKTKVTENRLDQELIKFNNQLATNARLREELDHLRQEKAVFDAIHKRLSYSLVDTKREINVNINQATHAYEERDEAQTKMMALKERSDKDMTQQETEMKELQRIIKHDDNLKQFMGVKGHDRAELKMEEKAKIQKVSKDGDSDWDKQVIQQLQEAFDRIKETTGEDDITKIVCDFIKKEDQNFALYNFVNELNDTVDNIQEKIEEMGGEIKRFEDDDVKNEESRRQIIHDMEIQCDKFKADKDQAEINNVQVRKVLDEIRAAVGILFRDANCDSSTISDMLGNEAGVTNKNILKYMGLIEQRTMELVQLHQYIQMMKEPPKQEKKDSKGQPTTPVQGGAISPRVMQIAIVAPNTADEEDCFEDSELRPLTRNEIKSMVMRTLGTPRALGEHSRKKTSGGKRNKTNTPSISLT